MKKPINLETCLASVRPSATKKKKKKGERERKSNQGRNFVTHEDIFQS
jgi:hypothetical protein